MAQHDYNVINGPGRVVRDDINAALAAIVTNNSGPLEPATKVPGTLWFDTSDPQKPGTLRIYGLDGNWHYLAAGAVYVPLAGGNVIGDLTVAGVFSNPDYNNRRKNYISGTAPASPVAGMLWYDTSATPDALKIRNAANTAWVELVDVTSPVFTQMVNVEGTGSEVDLVSAGETRRIVNNASLNRLDFFNSANTLIATISDAGDLWISSLGWIAQTLQGKQPNLGFTPVQQVGSNTIMIGYSTPHLWVDNVDQGVIRLGSSLTLFSIGQVGFYTRCTTVDPTVPGNGLIAGGNLRIGTDSSTMYGTGTYRNMGGQVTDAQMAMFQRIS